MKISIAIFFILLISVQNIAQNKDYSNKSIKIGVGMGMTQDNLGLVYQVGYQKISLKNDRLRFNPNLTLGAFSTMGITDASDVMIRITSLEYRVHYDFLRIRNFAATVQAGPFLNYTRGLDAGGGDPEACGDCSGEGFIHKLYGGGLIGLGIRFNHPDKSYTVEIKPLTLHYGLELNKHNPENPNFQMGYFQIGVDFKLRN